MATEAVVYWQKYVQPNGKTYTCPWCASDLKPFTCGAGAKPENQGRSFVNCSNKDGKTGCGLYCFLDELPKEKFRPKGQKRERAPDGNILTGPVANTPGVLEDAVARMQTDLTKIKAVVYALAEAQGIKIE